jgi:siroheme decarboxylase
MSGRERQLAIAVANRWQRGFPLCARPFAMLADAHGLAEQDAIAALDGLRRANVISRLGAVVRPNTVGASTLAALSCDVPNVEDVARIVSAERFVNHNYERDHRLNLWFVVAAPDEEELQETLSRVAQTTGRPILDLRLERSYHIDLGFDLESGQVARNCCRAASRKASDDERLLLAEIEDGLPFEPRPYLAIAGRLGWTETRVVFMLQALLEAGIITRLGCVIRHREVGFTANAMAVWDVPAEWVDAAGHRLAGEEGVTLCYRRNRVKPDWPYNLFAMVHGRDETTVLKQVERLSNTAGLESCARSILFSRRCFTQRGARFSRTA